MPADSLFASVDLSLPRIRDCTALAFLLTNADAAERRSIGRQIANVLAALPGAQAELAAQAPRASLSRLKELARQVALLEATVLELMNE